MTTETQKPQTNALLEKVECDYKNAQEELKRTVLVCRQAKKLIPLIPEVILRQPYYIFRQTEPGKWYLETLCLDEEKANALVKQLKLAGVYGFRSKFAGSKRWHYTGSFMAGNDEIVVMVDGGSKPPLCRIEETKEWKEIITYKAICEETEEEV